MAYQKLQTSRGAAVTPSDTLNIPSVSTQNGRGNNGCVLYVATGGDLKVLTSGGDEVSFAGFPDGSFLPVYFFLFCFWSHGGFYIHMLYINGYSQKGPL